MITIDIEIPEIREQSAPINGGVRVVSAVTEQGIIRGIASTWSSPSEIAKHIVAAVGYMNLDQITDWTTCTYYHPFYLPRPKEPASGIYLFPWDHWTLTGESPHFKGNGPHWEEPRSRRTLKDIDSVKLLHRPKGWSKQDYPIASNDPDWFPEEDAAS